MSASEFRYTIDYYTEKGDRLDTLPLEPDWQPVEEWMQFMGVRAGRLPAVTATPSVGLEPVWDEDEGEPVVGGVRASVSGCGHADDEPLVAEIPRTFFRAAVRRGSSKLIDKGLLESGDPYLYTVSAFRAPEPANGGTPEAEDLDFGFEEVVEEMPILEGSMDEFSARSEPTGEPADAEDFPVFVAASVLEEAMALAAGADKVETGGVLAGHLRRAGAGGDLFLEVTAFIPGPHAESSGVSFTFTADTWSSVSRVLELRGLGEQMVGWAHSHPDWCSDCEPERASKCTLARPFFSTTDMHLHRVIFQKSHQVALLVNESSIAGMTTSLFGWRRGMVAAREFHILADSDPAMARAAETA